MLETEPRAAAAHYDAATGRVVVHLANGCAYAFPTRHIQDLHDASGEDLAKIEVDGAGFNLRWPSLDVDLYVPALVNGIFGNRAWMARELARLAGQTRSAEGGRLPLQRRQGRPATQGGEELTAACCATMDADPVGRRGVASLVGGGRNCPRSIGHYR